MQDQIPSTQEREDLAPSTPTQESTDSSAQTPESSVPDQENGQDQAPTLPQPPLLPETDAPTDTQPPELPQDDGQKLEALKQEIAQAIKDNAGVIANTHYTLQGIAELLSISDDLFRFYRYHAETIKLNQEQYENLQANLQTIISYINQSLKHIDTTHTSILELFTTTEALLDEAKSLAQSTQADLEAVQKVLEISHQELEPNLAKLESAKLEIQTQLNLAQSMKEQIEALAPNILNEMRTQLLSDKEQYKREIESHKTQALESIETQAQQSQNAINQAEQSACFNLSEVLKEALEQIQNATPAPRPEQEQKPSAIYARLADYELEATL